LDKAKKRNKGVWFWEAVDFGFPSIKGFFDRGGRE
jgi:hypothetical protein